MVMFKEKYKKSGQYLIAFFLSFSFVNLCLTQQLLFSNLSVENGLSQSTVNAILQDRNGFMWFGTGDGLNRYDGNKFQIFKHDELDSFSLINNSIRTLLEDKNGNIWIGTDEGITQYDPTTKKFHPILPATLKNCYLLNIVNNKVWYWKYDFGIGSINIDSKKVSVYPSIEFSKSTIINASTYIANTNELLLATNRGILTTNIVKHTALSIINGTANNTFYAIKLTSKNALIAGSDKGIFFFNNIEKSKQIGYRIKNETSKFIVSIEEDLNGRIWLASYGKGLFLLNKQEKTIDKIEEINPIKSINLIKKIYKDFANNIWIGTDGNGLKIWANYKSKFKHISSETNLKPNKLSANFVKCFVETNDHKILIACFDKGINIFDPISKSNTITYKYGKNIYKIYKDSFKDIWIVADKKLRKYNADLSNSTLIQFPQKPYTYHPSCIYTDSKKNTWIGCTTGLYKLDSFQKLSFVNHSDSFAFQCIFEDSKHILWFATSEDVMHINNTNNILYKVKSFEKTNIRNITEANNYLWLSGNKGLFNYSMTTKKKSFFGISSGLPDLMIYGVIASKNNCLWISSDGGLSKFDMNTQKVRNYHINDGLQSNEFNSNAFLKAANGLLYFGGINGFNYFDPETIIDNPNIPQTAITSIKLFDNDLPLKTEVSQLKEMILTYDQNILSFEFSSLEYTDIGKNAYFYKMEGIDTGWVFSSTRNFARYANMLPGDYTFKVKSVNNDGVGGTQSAAIKITILHPWWQSGWFKVLIGILIFSAIYFSVKFTINRKLLAQKRINEKLIAVEQERSRISKDMHDDMGSGLSKIAIMSQILKVNLETKSESEQIEKISQTAQDLVGSMGQIVWAMNPENNGLENLTSYIRAYVIDFFEGSEMECLIDFPDEELGIPLSQQQRRNLFLVVKETLNNTLKYALATQLKVTLYLHENKLFLVISDNGIGFDLTQTRRFGNGLVNIKKRIEEIGGECKIESILNVGTTTTICI